MAEQKQNSVQVDILGNIYNNILNGLSKGKDLIMLQGSARSGKTFNTLIFIILECLQKPIRERKIQDPVTGKMLTKKEPLRVSIVRNSLPVIKRSVYEDFKTIMINMGQWEDRRMNRTDYIYTFANGATIEFFSAEDEQKLRGPWRHILYINEANEIYYYSFSMLRQRTYEYTIVDYNPSFTEEHWLFPLMKDERSYHFISTYKDNIFLPAPAIREIESYQTTNPALWQIFGKGEFAIVEGLVFPKENWDIIEDDAFPTWLGEEIIGIDWGFQADPTTFIGVIISGEDIYARELHYQMGMKTKDIAEALEPYAGNYKYCDIDNRLVTELEDAGIPLLTMTKKNSESIMSGIRLMNQRRIHVTNSSNDLIKELKNYVYKKDRHDTYQTNLKPIDKFNHCFDYHTLIATVKGYKPIGEMKVGDMVYNSQGIFPVQKVFRNGVQEIWDLMIEYENGSKTELSVTPNHKIKTKYGWKQVQELTTGDTVYLLKSSMEKHISSITEKDTFQEERKDFMSQYGNFTMAQSLKDSMFITKMKTLGIILSKILSVFKAVNTCLCTFKKKCKTKSLLKNSASEWTTHEYTQISGTEVKKVSSGIENKENKSLRIFSQENTPAYIAERNSGKNHSEKISSAPINANQHGEESRAVIMKRESVNTAEKNLQPTSTAGQNFVEEAVVKSMFIKSKRNAKTYNLMITDVHEYIAHNLLVSNCIDALRYVVYAECGGINSAESSERELSKEDLGIFM